MKSRVGRERQKKEDAGAQKGRNVAKHCVFSMFSGSGRSKSRLATAAGAEPIGQMKDKQLYGIVARSTCRSQSASAPEHVSKLRCRKSAGRSGTKQISKSKCTRHTRVGPCLDVQMSKKCMLLRGKAHCQVQVRATFGRSDVDLCGR